jgi:DNA-binding NarL/FixJ family response regulator
MIRPDGQPTVEGQGGVSCAEAPSTTISSKTIRIALLSDSALFRSGLRRLLSSDRSFLVVGEITAPPMREVLRSSVPQILLVDAQTPRALEICRELRLIPRWESWPSVNA